MKYISFADFLKMEDKEKVLVNRINIFDKYQHICMVNTNIDKDLFELLNNAVKIFYSKDRQNEICNEIEMQVSEVKRIFSKEDFSNPTALAINVIESSEKPLCANFSTKFEL